MEAWLVVGYLILLGIIGFYSWLLFRSFKQVKQENMMYRHAIDRQLKILAFPHLYCDMQGEFDGSSIKLELFNIGSVAAQDLHLSLIAAYTEESIDIPTFMRTHVQPRHRKIPLQVDKVGYYGVRSSSRCAILPVQKRLSIALSLPLRPVDIYALIQFRDILGTNYHQVYCFSALDEKGSYRANILEPQGSEPLDRLHFYDLEDLNLVTPHQPLPFAVEDFVDLWNHSLSLRTTSLYAEETNQLQEVRDVS
jgi:hypothetical protein